MALLLKHEILFSTEINERRAWDISATERLAIIRKVRRRGTSCAEF